MDHLNFRQQEEYLTMQTQMNRIRAQILRNDDFEIHLRNHYREKEWELTQLYIRLGSTPRDPEHLQEVDSLIQNERMIHNQLFHIESEIENVERQKRELEQELRRMENEAERFVRENRN